MKTVEDPGEGPESLGPLWPPRAHLGGLLSLKAWGAGAVALAEGSCLHQRVTLATTGCMSQTVEVADWPLAQAAKGL